jgi:hypothetical protein
MSDVQENLQQELDKAERSLRNTLIAMGIVSVVVMGYFGWMRSQLAELLEPENVAEFVVNETRRSLPGASQALRDNLKSGAPDVVKFVMSSVLDGVLPMVQKELRSNLESYSTEVATLGTNGMLEVFREVVRTHKDELMSAEPADSDTIALALAGHIERELDAKMTDAQGETVKAKLDQSVVALERINDQLERMSKGRHLSREDELGKRFITTWWTFLDQNKGELPGADLLAEGSDVQM